MNQINYPLTIYYDASCPLCNAEMSNLMLRNHRNLLRFVDISSTPNESPLPGIAWEDMMRLIHAQTTDGRVLVGVSVFRLAYEAVGLGWVTRATTWPLIAQMADHLYPLVATNRHRIPRRLVSFLFEGLIRRAAQQAAKQAHCQNGQCLHPNPENRS